MRMKGSLRDRVPVLLRMAILAASVMLFASCTLFGQEAPVVAEETPLPTFTPAPTNTPEPQEFLFSMPTPTPRMTPNPTPTPTPTPAITPVPFSYYAPTVNMSFAELVGGTSDFGELGSKTVRWPKAYPPADTYKLVVDIYWQVVAAYEKDESGKYTVPVRYMLCSTGNPKIRDGGETRRGTFNLLVPRVRFGHFLSGEAAQYWTLIRSRTYFHSILYDKQNKMSTYQVETYKALGSKNSHGCIRLTVPDARWIWYNCSYGTVCEIRDGSKNDEEMRWVRENLILPEPPSKQATITAGQTPYTDNWTIDTVLDRFEEKTWVKFKNEKQPPPAMKADDEQGSGSGGNGGGTPSAPVTPGADGSGTGVPSVQGGGSESSNSGGSGGSSGGSDSGGDQDIIIFATGTP